MKILLPNAKELNTNEESQAWQELPDKSHDLLHHFLGMSVEELASFYKLKVDRACLEYDRFKRMEAAQARTYEALLLYDGLMYRYMKRRNLTSAEGEYWTEHVRIATGFYGLIKPFKLICPHRLDFQGKLDLGGQTLKQYWRKDYDKELEDTDIVLSLLSSEFEQVFSPKLQEKMTKIIFMEDQQGHYKIHSTISKKGRGRLVSLMAEKNILTLEQIKELVFDGFSYLPEKSSTNKLVFVRNSENR